MSIPTSTPEDTARIIDAARQLFGERGFGVADAEIAAAAGAGVSTERLGELGDRAALVEAVIGPLFAERWQPAWSELLVDRRLALEERLSRLYIEYRGRVDRTEARLWTWAGLDGAHASGRISGTLVSKLIAPLIAELRHECGLPGFEQRPLCVLERELVQALHGAVAFINTRRFVFASKIEPSLETLVPMIVRAFLPGARQELVRIHGGKGAATLDGHLPDRR